jgi:deoxyadenosine/deoxycytidine kinase
LIAGTLPEPDLLIYLKAPPKVLLDRIVERGRKMESGITLEYLSLLDRFYDDWMKTFDLCPVLTIRSDDLDFVHKPGHLDIVVNRIQEKLTVKEEVVFPNDQ